MTEDDGTPQALPEWETGPHRDPADPHNYLPDDPTAAEQRLADALDREAVNVHLAKIAIRGWGHALWIGRADGFFKRARRYVLTAVSAAAVNLAAVGIYVLNRHDDAVAAHEHAAGDERINDERRAATSEAIKMLWQEVLELRRELRRLSGASPSHLPSSDIYVLPDKLSLTNPGKEPHALRSP